MLPWCKVLRAGCSCNLSWLCLRTRGVIDTGSFTTSEPGSLLGACDWEQRTFSSTSSQLWGEIKQLCGYSGLSQWAAASSICGVSTSTKNTENTHLKSSWYRKTVVSISKTSEPQTAGFVNVLKATVTSRLGGDCTMLKRSVSLQVAFDSVTLYQHLIFPAITKFLFSFRRNSVLKYIFSVTVLTTQSRGCCCSLTWPRSAPQWVQISNSFTFKSLPKCSTFWDASEAQG